MKNIIFFLSIAAFCSTQFIACTCEDHDLPITQTPDPFVVESISFEDEVLNIYFTKELNAESVILGQNFRVYNENGDYSDNEYIIIEGNYIGIYPCFDSICAEIEACSFTIAISGEEDGGIYALDGSLLDGDRDGTNGGDYLEEMTVSCGDVQTILPIVSSTNAFGSSALTISNFFDSFMDEIVVTFNKPINPQTVVMNKTIFVKAGDEDGVQYAFPINGLSDDNLSWNDNFTELRIMDISLAICTDVGGSCSCTIYLELLDEITDTEGLHLDGNYDNIEGSDYIESNIITESPNVAFEGDTIQEFFATLTTVGDFFFSSNIQEFSVTDSSFQVFLIDSDGVKRQLGNYEYYTFFINNNTGIRLDFEGGFLDIQDDFQLKVVLKGTGNNTINNFCGNPINGDNDNIVGGDFEQIVLYTIPQ